MAIDDPLTPLTVVTRRLVDEVWNKGRYEVVTELVATEHVLRDPLAPETRGVEGFVQFVRSIRTAFPISCSSSTTSSEQAIAS